MLDEAADIISDICGVPAVGSDRGIFIITDSGVPSVWLDKLKEQLSGVCEPEVYTFARGEASKNIEIYSDILAWLAVNRASRKSLVVALGGGVCGDMAGFAAATYMRGIEYINIPTTSLSQIDSSVGGKTAIDHRGIKNIVGAFHQPSAVIIDPDTLSTLSARELSNGLAEAVKAGLIGDRRLFEIFEQDDYMEHIEEIIERSLRVKKRIVEEDENESSLRKLLNFGHTFGHAYESYFDGKYLHGECVAMGMMTVLEDDGIKRRVAEVLKRLGLPEAPEGEAARDAAHDTTRDEVRDMTRDAACDAANDAAYKDRILSLLMNDKKAAGDTVDIVRVREIGSAVIEPTEISELSRMIGQGQFL